MSTQLRRMYFLLKFMRITLPALTVLSMLAMILIDQPWANWVYAVALAGSVGMFTNTIAIKMLFHPLHPTPLNRQGVIPRNKERIAHGLSIAIENNVLNPDQILDYIEHYQLIDQGLIKADRYLEQYLRVPQNRERLISKIIELSEKILPELMDKSLTWAASRAREFAAQQEILDQLHRAVVEGLTRYLDKPDNRQHIYVTVHQLLKNNLPAFAELLYQFLEKYQKNLSGIRKYLTRLASLAMEVNPERIREVLEEMLENPDTRQQLIDFIDQGINRFYEYLEAPDVRERISEYLHRFLVWFEEQGVPAVMPHMLTFLNNYLKRPESWESINTLLDGLTTFLRERARLFFQRPEQKAAIKMFIRRLIVELNIRQIIQRNLEGLPMDKFEGVIMQATGEHLAWLEILGGILGAIAGLSFIHWELIFVLPALILTILMIEKGLTVLQKSPPTSA